MPDNPDLRDQLKQYAGTLDSSVSRVSAGEALGTTVPGRNRRWPKRVLIAACLVVVLVAGAAGGEYLYLKRQLNNVTKVTLGKHVLRNDGSDVSGQPMNVLLVGSDSRADLTGADAKRQGQGLVTGQRSDTIMVLHVDPQYKKAAILSIPRDTYLKLANGHSGRINEAFNGITGPDTLINTIHQQLGLEIDHYVYVDFVGFRGLTNAVGGVPVWIPARVRDPYSDLRIDTPGCVTLNGDQALAWVRSRHLEYYETGRWHSDPRSDFGRIARQQDFIRRLLRRSISKGVRNPIRLNQMIASAVQNVSIDKAMSSKDIINLAKRFRSLDPSSVDMMTLPTYGTTVGAADVLKLQQPQANFVLARFTGHFENPTQATGGSGGTSSSSATSNVVPSEVRLRILNGSGVTGRASKVAAALQDQGFQSAGFGDARRYTYTSSVVNYATGQIDKARLVASAIDGPVQLQEVKALTGVDVELIVGRDYLGVRKATGLKGSGPTSSTSTSTTSTSTSTPPTTAPGFDSSNVPIPVPAAVNPQC